MVKRKHVIWDKEATSSLKKAIQWINQDSPKNATKVKAYFLEVTRRLTDNPEAHPPDKFRNDYDSRFRAFEKYSYRVAYFIGEDTIRVLRFRHVKQEPLDI